jgi:hypothetical protein
MTANGRLTSGQRNAMASLYGGRSTIISINAVYLGLSLTEPDAAGGNITEPVGGNYRRALIGSGSQSLTQIMGAPVDGVTTNERELHFEETTAPLGTIGYYFTASAVTGGTIYAIGTLDVPISPIAGDGINVRVGDLRIAIT